MSEDEAILSYTQSPLPDLGSSPAQDAGDEPIDPARAVQLLNQLRDQLADGAATCYAEHLGAARHDLHQLAERANEPELRETYESAHAFITNSGLGLLVDFRRVFSNDVDTAVGKLTGQAQDAWDAASELCLVDAQDFERDLAVGKLAAKATYACSQQLTALDRRIAALLGLKRLDADGNPLAPRRLLESFLKASSSSWAGEQLSLVLLETFEHYTARALPGLYQELNQTLIDAGVLPRLPMLSEDGTELEETRGNRGGGDTGGSGIGDVFVQLASGLSQARYGASGAAMAGLAGATGSAPGGGMSGNNMGAAAGGDPNQQFAPLVLGQFINGLTGLQRGVAQASATLGVETGDFDPTSSALLHSLGQSPLLRWLQPNEALTVDLVAQLFDCIFSDPEVPTALQAEIGRLQVPVLKVALLNRSFFSDQRHPARRLMDVIAQAARGWGPREQDALLKSIHSAVDNITAGFDNDTGVFAAQIARLEGILQGADRRAREKVSPLVRRLEQRDRKQVAEAAVADQIDRRLAAGSVPPVVQRFIDEVWREVLRLAYIDEGESSATWRSALTTLEQLIWSVQPKSRSQERRELMDLLPGLLDALPTGMARIGRGESWDDFLIALMDLHMAAIKPKDATSAPGTIASPPAAATNAEPAAQLTTDLHSEWNLEPLTGMLPEFGTPDGQIEPDSTLDAEPAAAVIPAPSVPPEPNAATPTIAPAASAATPATADLGDDAEAATAARIAIGDWVTFCLPERPEISLRTCWISRYGGLLLFADRPGEHARALTRAQLARELRQGTARVLSNAQLTDRAVAALLVRAAPTAKTPNAVTPNQVVTAIPQGATPPVQSGAATGDDREHRGQRPGERPAGPVPAQVSHPLRNPS